MAYLAIIRDSFREALSSRILWVLIALITLGLVALLPLGWKTERTSRFRPDDMRNVRDAMTEFVELKQAEPDTLGSYLWERLPADRRTRLGELEIAQRPRGLLRLELSAALNELIEQPDLYDAELWGERELDEEGQQLAAGESLGDADLRRLNRLALEAAFPGRFRRAAAQSIVFYYLVWDFDFLPPLPRRQAEMIVEGAAVTFMLIFVGALGVFIGILVTASMIPQTFDTGSINLLLSKPISRSLLFLAKYIGGCSFVLINAAYLAVGLWLILGTRFQLWKPELLWCIPTFLFVFAIFYSVSALAGVVWRSTVMSIVMTIVFWFVCTAVGTVVELTQFFAIQPSRLTKVILSPDGEMFAVRQNGSTIRRDTVTGQWEDVFASSDNGPSFGPPMLRRSRRIGPVYVPSQKRLVALKPQWPEPRILAASAEDRWQSIDLDAGPREADSLVIEGDGRLLMISDEGAFRLSDSVQPAEEGLSFFGITIPAAPQDSFAQVAEMPAGRFDSTTHAAFDHARNELVIVREENVYRFTRNDAGDYELDTQAALSLASEVTDASNGRIVDTISALAADDETPDDQERKVTSIGAAAGKLLVAYDTGELRLLSPADGQDITFRPFRDNYPLSCQLSGDGRWAAVLYQHDRVWLWDDAEQRDCTRDVVGQGRISALQLDRDSDRLLLGDLYGRVIAQPFPELESESLFAPGLSWIQRLYRYFLKPVYTVFPKPSKLEDTVNYLVSGKETVAVNGPMGELHVKLDPWGPVWSSAGFAAVVLAIGCIYMRRQEF